MSPNVRYTRVPGGTYLFNYRVANKNFDWSDGQSVQITVKKKITEFLLFWIVVFLLILGLLWYAYNQRMKTLKKQAKIEQAYNERINELEASALRLQMNPHFIFNAINSINWFIIKNDQENASNYLAKISRLIRLSLENSKSKLIPIKNELEAITIYLQMERLRFEEQFDFEIDVDENLNPSALYIPPMIIQPFVENAIWHGLMNKLGKGKISLTIKKLGENLRCIVEDDGIGRKAAQSINKKKIIKKKIDGIGHHRRKITYNRKSIRPGS